MPKNRNSALDRWTSLASSAPDVPRRIKAQAHSCLATGLLDQASEDPEQRDIDLLYRAGSNANEAVSLGLISPGALKVGFSIESQGFRRPKDNRLPGTDRFEQLAELWEAIDARTVEMERASGKGDGKPSKTPLKYVCSAEGCGIQATKKWGLLRCAGKCPVVFKPSYCSRECQKIVRRSPSALGLPIQCCCPRRTGNCTNRFVKLTLQSQACVHSIPTTTPQKIPGSGRRTRSLTSPKDEVQGTQLMRRRGTSDPIPRLPGRRR